MGWTGENKEEQEKSHKTAHNLRAKFSAKDDEKILAQGNKYGASVQDLEKQLGRTFYGIQKRRDFLRRKNEPKFTQFGAVNRNLIVMHHADGVILMNTASGERFKVIRHDDHMILENTVTREQFKVNI